MKSYLTIICLLLAFSVSSQSYKIGVRSGLNYSKFSGPLETSINEEFAFSGGFHFGFNFTWYFLENFGVRGELLYIRNGSKTSFNGETYYVTRLDGTDTNIEWGSREQILDISNAYLAFPITAHYQFHPKWEVFGGVSFNFLVSPSASGNISFDSKKCTENADGTVDCENPDGFFFIQSLVYDYNSDQARGARSTDRNPIIDIDGESVSLPTSMGAYYYYEETPETNYINKFDMNLTFGMNYFVNRGFYTGLRVDYGLRDLTNNALDNSAADINLDGSFITRDDKDIHLGIQASVGFRF